MRLKPCPFCGGHAVLGKATMTIVVDGKDKMGYFAYCLNCECRMPKYRKKESAIEAWNRREPIGKIVEQLEMEVERARTHGLCINDRRSTMQGLLKAIEIVKGGQNE